MPFSTRSAGVGPCGWCLVFSFFLVSLPAWAADKMRLRVDDYQIDAELAPHTPQDQRAGQGEVYCP